jgi:hypothetical protein
MLERRPIFLLPSGAALALFLTTGCATEAVVQAGAAVPLVRSARPAVALEAAVGIGPGDDHQGFGVESRIRGKFGSDITGTSLNTGFFFAGGSRKAEDFFFVGSVGVSVIGASYTQQRTSLDVGSPYAQFGIGHPLGNGAPSLTGSVFADYLVRTGSAPNVPYAGLMIGVGEVTYSDLHLR